MGITISYKIIKNYQTHGASKSSNPENLHQLRHRGLRRLRRRSPRPRPLLPRQQKILITGTSLSFFPPSFPLRRVHGGAIAMLMYFQSPPDAQSWGVVVREEIWVSVGGDLMRKCHLGWVWFQSVMLWNKDKKQKERRSRSPWVGV